MDKERPDTQQQVPAATEAPRADSAKNSWQEPKLTFVEPKLTRQGDFVEITGQFFGAFSP
jgi:hypothetical protein